jgi:hypothetical protein
MNGPELDRLRKLAAEWRTVAGVLDSNGAPAQATVKRRDAEELEKTVRELELEALTLRQAEAESGYSYSCLQKALQSGKIENAGTKGRPRIRRGDLPHKPPTPVVDGPDIAGRIRRAG